MSPYDKKPQGFQKEAGREEYCQQGVCEGCSQERRIGLMAAAGKPICLPAKLRKLGGGSETLPRIMRRIGLWVAAAAASVVGCFLMGCQRNDGGASRPAEAGDILPVTIGGVSFNMRWCPPGEFTMGSPSSEEDREDDERQHHVALTKGFWMGETEVTQALWQKVMGKNPSENAKGGTYPVENVSWNDCKEFVAALNALLEENGARLRFALPTEAQWEYACRAGTTGAYAGTGAIDDMGWDFDKATHPVKQKRPNAWGLYDMHGNVEEWCADWYGAYPSGAVTDPTGPASGESRVLRGGCYVGYPLGCRSADRGWSAPDDRAGIFGLRLAALQDGR